MNGRSQDGCIMIDMLSAQSALLLRIKVVGFCVHRAPSFTGCFRHAPRLLL